MGIQSRFVKLVKMRSVYIWVFVCVASPSAFLNSCEFIRYCKPLGRGLYPSSSSWTPPLHSARGNPDSEGTGGRRREKKKKKKESMSY